VIALEIMGTNHILALLISERDKLDGAIEALQGQTKASGPDRKAVVVPSVEPVSPVKRKLSAAGRSAIAEATKKRWAAIKAPVVAAPKPAPAAAKQKAAPVAAKRKTAPVAAKRKAAPVRDAAARKKMSDRMKAAWAARKKKAAAKGK
jgi:hypothetical protein